MAAPVSQKIIKFVGIESTVIKASSRESQITKREAERVMNTIHQQTES
jgi:hypothetical protein